MSFANNYISKQAFIDTSFQDNLPKDIQIITMVPCYREPFFISTLNALNQAAAAYRKNILLLVVLNAPADSEKETIEINQKTYQEIVAWQKKKAFNVHIKILRHEQLNPKKAGVGLARKIGMDAAIYYYNLHQRPDGIIVSFDADALCEANFFTAIENHYRQHPNNIGSTVYFEHEIAGENYSVEHYSAIIQYELYLRYFVQACRYTSFPYAYHTVGSCFNFRADVYCRQGGMNQRQGGEDFYFLHKLFPLGNFHEINETTVYPSSRISDRVPFGTGPAVKNLLERGGGLRTYNMAAFHVLQDFFEQIPSFYGAGDFPLSKLKNTIHESLYVFLEQHNFIKALQEIKANTASFDTFEKRFFGWFNGFRIIKFLNGSHPAYFEEVAVERGAGELLSYINTGEIDSLEQLLLEFRDWDKNPNAYLSK